MLQPPLLAHLPNPILTNIHHDNPKTDNRRGDKQTLRRVQETRSERPRVEVKPAGDHGDVEQEEHHVADEEDAAQRVQAAEAEGNGVQDVGDAAGCHGEAEPGPCEVADAFAPGEFGVSAGDCGVFWVVLRVGGGGVLFDDVVWRGRRRR